jgi:hypothetical protein
MKTGMPFFVYGFRQRTKKSTLIPEAPLARAQGVEYNYF